MKNSSLSWLLLLAAIVGCSPPSAPETKARLPARPSRQPNMPGPAVGTVAQDISGKDLDGVAFKLSDYRGKVVMLDFWGTW
jgi:hypothetical protein